MNRNVPSVSVTYDRNGGSTKADAPGMRPMQERACHERGRQCGLALTLSGAMSSNTGAVAGAHVAVRDRSHRVLGRLGVAGAHVAVRSLRIA